ncbi:uncharacterized protein [Neodiprion pinetum]|uniref:uncharacterized protein n=1 Tax=Neodiprion pinetum TaxID=441929 RepID=UPI00371649C5
MSVKAYMELAEQMERTYNLLREQPPGKENDAVINHWTDIGIANIQVLRDISMQRGATFGAKIRIQYTFTLLQSWVTEIRQLQHGQWDDVDSAFTSQIKTGVATNLRHENLDALLDDVQRVVTENLELVLREEGKVKVYLIQISAEVKSFNISNVAILLPSSKMRKLDETRLPAKAHFYSRLTYSNIRDADYKHAKTVRGIFHLESLGGHSDSYLKINVLLLADIFENCCASCFKIYDVDPLHYYTAPGLAFDAMLKHTNVNLQILDNPEMVLFIEKAIRGGVAQCFNRHARANNRFMGKHFDSSNVKSYLTYFDVNSLYGAAMSVHLAISSFEWEYQHIDITNHPDDSPIGCFLEVDSDYPVELHEDHKDLPLCPEYFTPPGSKNAKLATTFYPKTKYILHYRNLKQCLSLGLKVTKVHRVFKFAQSPWLEPYITLNTDMRKRSSNEFEKNFHKLMNNAVFGKTMENVRNHKDVELVTKWEGRGSARMLIARENFYSCTVFGTDMVIIEMNRVKVHFARLIYVGASILDLSKIFLYDFHYDYIKTNSSNKQAELIFTNTDSLIYQFNVPHIYDIIERDVITFDDDKRCLIAYQELTLLQCLIRNKKHDVSTIVQKKLAPSWQDAKRQLIPGQTDTVPWGFVPAPQ